MEKDKVITELLRRIANLEYEVERQGKVIEDISKYVNKMSYEIVIDNPKIDLVKILKKEKQDD